jgi:glycine/D-amino acid oxidase-like deaminating enzyme
MVNMVLESEPYWLELEAQTPVQLRDKVGTLWFGDPNVKSTEGNLPAAEKALTAAHVPYTSLTAKQIEQQYHFKDLPSTYSGLFQADGASINLKATIQTLYDWCIQSPKVTLLDQSPVIGIRQKGTKFHITSPDGVFTSEKLVITPGPYVNNVLSMLRFKVMATYWNMASAYFKKLDPKINYPTWFVFQEPVGKNGNQFYGFPEVDWNYPGYIRVAPDFVMNELSDPSQRTLVPNRHELAYTSEWVAKHMTGLDPRPRFKSTCMVALSKIPNKELLVDFAPDFVPNHENIVIYATGWAGKFVPLLGLIMAQLALDGSTPFDISHFQLGVKYFRAL